MGRALRGELCLAGRWLDNEGPIPGCDTVEDDTSSPGVSPPLSTRCQCPRRSSGPSLPPLGSRRRGRAEPVARCRSDEGNRASAAPARWPRRGLAITLQNGLGNREPLEAVLGSARVAAGITMLGATRVAPGEVSVVPGRIVLGEEPQTADRLGPLVARLRAAGIEMETTREVPRLVWTKLVASLLWQDPAHRQPLPRILTPLRYD